MVADAYADRTSVSLPKGHYTVRLQVKHDDTTLLESYTSTPMVLERKLDSAIRMPCYGSQADALQTTAVETIPLFIGTSCSVLFGEPGDNNLPATASAGDVFHGSVTYLKKSPGNLGSGMRPGGYPITFVCTGAKAPKPLSIKDNEEKTSDDAASTLKCADKTSATVFEMPASLLEAIRDTKLKYLSEIGDKAISDDVLTKDLTEHPFHLAYTSMVNEYPDHVPLHLSGLKYFLKCATFCVGNAALATGQQTYLTAVFDTSDAIFDMIDKVSIMTELGVLIDSNDSAAAKRRDKVKDIRSQVSLTLSVMINIFRERFISQ